MGSDYVLAVKQNRGRRYDDLRELLEEADETNSEGVLGRQRSRRISLPNIGYSAPPLNLARTFSRPRFNDPKKLSDFDTSLVVASIAPEASSRCCAVLLSDLMGPNSLNTAKASTIRTMIKMSRETTIIKCSNQD